MPLCVLGASEIPWYFGDIFVKLWRDKSSFCVRWQGQMNVNHLAATILEVRIFIWLFLKLESVFSDYLKRLHINTLFLFFNLILSFLFDNFCVILKLRSNLRFGGTGGLFDRLELRFILVLESYYICKNCTSEFFTINFRKLGKNIFSSFHLTTENYPVLCLNTLWALEITNLVWAAFQFTTVDFY